MKGSKYLSELIDISSLKTNALNIIKSPTGSGKTYFALKSIGNLCNDTLHEAVYLIDTINGKEQILRNYGVVPESWGWINDIDNDGLWFEPDKRIVIMTYAKFGYILTEKIDFYMKFKYIICDEIHDLIKFEGFCNKYGNPNFHRPAKSALECAVKNDSTIVIALTATPERVNKFFKAPSYNVPIDYDDLRRYENRQVYPYTNLNYLITSLDPSEVGICYTKHIHKMKELSKKVEELGFKPICIWSINNSDHPMTEEQLRVRESILKDFQLPKEYNFLIINSSSETSIKINTPIDFVIVNSVNQDTQIQVRGRANCDLSTLYILSDSLEAIDVPESFLNRPLSTEERGELCDILNLRNPAGVVYRWTTVNKRLVEQGYYVEQKRINNKHYYTITCQN